MSLKIQILGHGRTSSARATRYVRLGRAEWVDSDQTMIRFRESAVQAKVLDSDEQARRIRRTISDANYDRIRRTLTFEELRGIPFVGDINRLMARKAALA